MKKYIFTFTILFALLFSPILFVKGQTNHSPEIIHVHTGLSYVRGINLPYWTQGIMFVVTDQDGLDNLFTDGNLIFEIQGPDGEIYPKTGDELSVFVRSEENPPCVHVGWDNWQPELPEFGSFKITVTDADGLSTVYFTQPIVSPPPGLPMVLYPLGIISETNPIISWQSFRDTTGYRLEIFGSDGFEWDKEINVSSIGGLGGLTRPVPRIYEYRYDGPSLILGETYDLFVFASKDEIVAEIGDVGFEYRRVSNIRHEIFSVYNEQILENMFEDVKDVVDSLELSDLKHPSMGETFLVRFKEEDTVKFVNNILDLIDSGPEYYEFAINRRSFLQTFF